MKTKQLLALLLAALMTVCLFTGCATKQQTNDTPDPKDNSVSDAPDDVSGDAEATDDMMTFEYGGYTFTIDKTVPPSRS